ncbi:MAG: TIGR04165 family Cys-rich peptide [Euryarchaeota archaeon]|nr:TIGR04165 family Cys-rich peptide [Euryarchaeota archaeon]MBU4547386.1 TIGR04165 family Cys-rich peptide [Euryarchaeota archaeon]MBU4608857.1 TIGR04165 family Cys-rich peptide [Euryarchaeota archaeon]MBV1754649.1 TIGR04165 family Cys-rich peptide [Methanobacterium sp.]MBV1767811.1 TIGR04165 family Cys-rich peptide [Methanobacterium sp.]
MKMEELMKKCPKCGCKDKKILRKIQDEHRAHATMKGIVCEECGYEFQSEEKED